MEAAIRNDMADAMPQVESKTSAEDLMAAEMEAAIR